MLLCSVYCQSSALPTELYEVKSVRTCDILELNLVPPKSVCFYIGSWFFIWCYVLRCRMCLWCYSECTVYPHGASWVWTAFNNRSLGVMPSVLFVVTVVAKSYWMMWKSVHLSRLIFCVAVCKLVVTDWRDISILYHVCHLDMFTTVTTKWKPGFMERLSNETRAAVLYS